MTRNGSSHEANRRHRLEARIAFLRAAYVQRLRILRAKIVAAPNAQIDPPRRPIFIIGAPRSGTTLLFHLLRGHESLRSLPVEGHVLWGAYQHPRLKAWSSDRAVADDIRDHERRYVYAGIGALAGESTFLDKTPKNALKVPYLIDLFPDARFVFLKRDGRAVVSSLIEGWRMRRGISYRLPVKLHLADYRGPFWCYLLPPGWRDLVRTSIAEVAAHQYVSSCETALDDLRVLPSERRVDVVYEELVSHPVDEARRLMDQLELAESEPVVDFARHLADHRAGAISAPRLGKWRDRAREIEPILPTIGPTMSRLGYEALL